MNTAEEVYKSMQSLPEHMALEVLHFVEFLKFKQELELEKTPNELTIKAMQEAENGKYEKVDLDGLKKQWEDA